MKRAILFFALISCACAARGADKPTAQKPLVVHEWGTFTSLQDEKGNAIAGINSDDEPVPDFVHRIADKVLVQNIPPGEILGQGAPQSHPDVTMRLETPVLYFYPPAGWKTKQVDVHVAFHGGWLTEFYPKAAFLAPGFEAPEDARLRGKPFGRIDPNLDGELTWKGMVIGPCKPGPETTEKVWLAPRDVDSTPLTAANGETEKFLFYRGVALADASLRIVRDIDGKTLDVCDNPREPGMKDAATNLRVHAAWLVDVREDGTCAFKSLGKLEYGKKARAVVPDSFAPADYGPDNMAALRADIHAALVNEGLFDDEANALLNTWEISYFKSPGTRFFYLCPRVDISYRLALHISVPATVTRVMMGRIEIVTPRQRDLLRQIASGPAVTPDAAIPAAEMDAYQKLGRFRNALILDEQKRRPTPALNQFISTNNLWGYNL